MKESSRQETHRGKTERKVDSERQETSTTNMRKVDSEKQESSTTNMRREWRSNPTRLRVFEARSTLLSIRLVHSHSNFDVCFL